MIFAKKRITAVAVTMAIAAACLGQTKGKPNPRYLETKHQETLGSFFPVDDIQQIVVTNNYGTHKLTTKELLFVKEQLKQAKFSGGLLLKPGHIVVVMTLKTKTRAQAGYVYASTGSIHFEGGRDIRGKYFTGTYYLPYALNFDNYQDQSSTKTTIAKSKKRFH